MLAPVHIVATFGRYHLSQAAQWGWQMAERYITPGSDQFCYGTVS